MSDSSSDRSRSHKPQAQTSSRHKNDTNETVVNQPQNDPQVEQQEMLEVLDTGSREQPNPLTPKDDVIDKYVEEDLGITDPDSQPQPTGPAAAGFTPTIGRPERRGKGKSGENTNGAKATSSPASTVSGDTTEKKKLSDFINEERSSLQKNLETKSNNIKSQKVSAWNFRGKIKSRLKRAILGMAIAALVAVPIAAIGIIPHAVQSWIANRTSVYVERAADKMGQKMLFAFIKNRVAVGKCKDYYNLAANFDPLQASCRPRLDEKDGRISQLFNDWHAAKMEDKLYNKGINVEYDPKASPGKPYKITIDGENFEAAADFGSPDWNEARFVGRREGTNILKRQMKVVLKEDTRWWQYLKRRNMKSGYLRDLNLRNKFHVPDKIARKLDDLDAKRLNRNTKFRKFLAKYIIQVGRGRVANIIGILLTGKRVSREEILDMNRVGRKNVVRIPDEKIEKLIKKYAGKDKKGIAKEIIKDIAEMLGRKLSNEAVEEIVEAASKAIPVIGWITLAFTILDLLEMVQDGTFQKYISVMNSQSMLDMSNYMDTTLSEERRGYVDVESGGDLRLTLIKGMSASRIFTNTVGYKSPKDKQAEGYDCRPDVSISDMNSIFDAAGAIFGGKDSSELKQVGMKNGQDTCENHRVDYNPAKAFTDLGFTKPLIDALLNPYTNNCAVIPPGFEWLNNILPDFITKECPSTQDVYHSITGVISWLSNNFVFNWVTEKIASFPPIKFLLDKFTGFIVNAVSVLITGNSLAGAELLQGGLRTDTKTGARIFDSWSGGQQVTQNAFAKGVGDGGGLGLVAQTPAETGALNKSIAQERKEELASGSIFERMFDMSHVDTLASGVSAFAFTEAGFSNIVNPFNNIALAFSSGSASTFAGNADQDYCGDANQFGKAVTEFGVICYAIADDLIDGLTEEEMVQYSDPEFCKQYTAELDAELAAKEAEPYPSPNQDPDGSGQATKPNYCRLMCSVTDSMGTNFRSNDKICGFEKYASGSSAGSSSDDDSGGGGSNNDPVEGAMGQCEGAEVTRPNAGKPNDFEMQLVPGTNITVRAIYCKNVKEMVAAAQADGLNFSNVSSSFRTYEQQVNLRRQNCGSSQYAIYDAPSSSCRPPTARPGTSMHEKGTAIDFANCGSRSTACYKWLAANASRFGYKNFPKESWHWSTTGR